MITLWRVDAIHDLGGEMTHFYEHAEAAHAQAEQLRVWGWFADAYIESIDAPSPAALHELLNRPHPNAPPDTLLGIVAANLDADGWQQLREYLDSFNRSSDAEVRFALTADS